MSLATWLGFMLAAILIAITPGPGAIASMSAGMAHGYRQAGQVILGLQVALLIQIALVALGMGAALALSEKLFVALKYLGAFYLVMLGWQKWRSRPQSLAVGAPKRVQGLFVQGVLVNLSNPKAILFVAALLPQFVDSAAPLWSQYLILAATLCVTDCVVMSGYALAAARIRHWLDDPAAIVWQNRFFGGLFVLAGVLLGWLPSRDINFTVN